MKDRRRQGAREEWGWRVVCVCVDGLRKVGVPKRVRGRGQEAEGGVADGEDVG